MHVTLQLLLTVMVIAQHLVLSRRNAKCFHIMGRPYSLMVATGGCKVALCKLLQINGTNYASYRTMIKFNGTTDTAVKDMMFMAVGGGSAGRCTGGYDTTLYKNVAALFKPFKVSQNSEWPAPLCIAHAAPSYQGFWQQLK